LSDTNEIHTNSTLSKKNYEVFDEVILSCEIGKCKREDVLNNTSKFFDYAINKFNILPNESIFIDDLMSNCEVANKV
jgi:FMN phosphatase YigB (HAD superfamily)